MYDPNAVKIYTDGSAKPTNPGRGGIGLVIEFPDSYDCDNCEISIGYKISTNNRMELKACVVGLEWLRTQKFTRAIMITDSEYVFYSYKNASFWKKGGWKTEEGRPYENSDLWNDFLREWQKVKFPVEIKWEKGKTRKVLLRVDTLAKDGADRPTETDYGFQSGKFTAPRTAGKKAAVLYSPNGEELLIRVYRKNIYGKNEKAVYKIFFDVYDEVSRVYNKKYFAYQGEDCMTMKRNNCYRVVFNASHSYPQILKATEIEYLRAGTN